jgi:hypothetical protein
MPDYTASYHRRILIFVTAIIKPKFAYQVSVGSQFALRLRQFANSSIIYGNTEPVIHAQLHKITLIFIILQHTESELRKLKLSFLHQG